MGFWSSIRQLGHRSNQIDMWDNIHDTNDGSSEMKILTRFHQTQRKLSSAHYCLYQDSNLHRICESDLGKKRI